MSAVFKSNCLVQAIKAKIKNRSIKLRLWTRHRDFCHGLHIYWEDGGKFYHHCGEPCEEGKSKLLWYVWHDGQIKELFLKKF